MSCHSQSNPILAGMGLGGGGGGSSDCKGSGVEIADGERGPWAWKWRGAERSLEKRLSYLLRRTAKSESREDFIGGTPSPAINPVILQENCKCSLQKLSAHCS